jgi:hypothetical protein
LMASKIDAASTVSLHFTKVYDALVICAASLQSVATSSCMYRTGRMTEMVGNRKFV